MEDIVFKQKKINLGTISLEDGIINTVYEFTNKGSTVFKISSMEAACGCTSPKTEKLTYLPGESGEIKVQFDPKGMRGMIEKWIYVRGNYNDGFQIELEFSAQVKSLEVRKKIHYPGEFGYLQMARYDFFWGVHTTDDVYNDTMLLTNDGYNPIVVKDFKNLPAFISANNVPLTIAVGDTLPLVFTIDLRKYTEVGPTAGSVKMMTNDRFYAMKEWNYSIEVYPNYAEWGKRKKKNGPKLTFDQSTVDVGKIKSGAKVSKSIIFTNEGKKELKILRTEADCSCTLADLPKKTLQPGESMEVKVTFDSIFKEGLKRKVVTIYSNDPNNPKQTFIVQADVI